MLRSVNALVLAGGLSAMPVLASAATMQVLYPFAKSGASGCYPDGTLLREASGALYGATYSCGVNNSGTVFKLKPPQPGQTRWTSSVLYTFLDPDNGGWLPNPGLIKDGSGALYGTTTYGGPDLQGVVYKLTPPAAGTRWTQTVLHAFHFDYAEGDGDGSHPGGGLIMDRAGALYGTTMLGGTLSPSGPGYGTVFKLTPPRPGETAWSETVLYRFAGGADGWSPLAVLTADAPGALYGTTLYGGIGPCKDNWTLVAGCGTVFKLTPPVPPRTAWTKTTLYRFRGGRDGGQPHGRLLPGAGGALYGTTFQGGRGRCEDGAPSVVIGCGTVFRLAPPARGQGAWVESVLHDFMGPDGGFPQGGLIAGAGGVLYGTASGGGDGYGVVFKLSPPAGGKTKWKQTVLAKLNVLTSGFTPVGELAADPAGRLFGVAFWGGPNLFGSVFAITP